MQFLQMVRVRSRVAGLLTRLGGIAIGVTETEAVHVERVEATGSFMIWMPEACPEGCHPIFLVHNGRPVSCARVRDSADTNRVIGDWAEALQIPRDQIPGMATHAAEMVEQFNRVPRPAILDDAVFLDQEGPGFVSA